MRRSGDPPVSDAALSVALDPYALTEETIPVVETVTDLRALAIAHERVRLEGWNVKGDGGGGILDYNAASTGTDDGGLTFAPAVTGRYTRPADGVLHSRWFGIQHSTTLDQSAALQRFLWALCPPGGPLAYYGVLDPGTVDCAGATVYMERNGQPLPDGDGTGSYANNAQLVGANWRSSILRNLNLVVGTPRWKQFTASGIRMRDFRIEGRLHIQNTEGNSFFENLYVGRGSLDTLGSPMLPNVPNYLLGTSAALVPGDPHIEAGLTITGITQANPAAVTIVGHGYSTGDKVYLSAIGGMTALNGTTKTVTVTGADTFTIATDTTAFPAYTAGGTAKRGVTWLDFLSDYMVTLYAANHPLFTNLNINGKAGTGIPSGNYRRGFLNYASVNTRFLQGTFFGCNDALVIDGAGADRVHCDGLKFEECEATHIWARAGGNHIFNTWHRLGNGHGISSPLIRLGEAAVATVDQVIVRTAKFLSDRVALAAEPLAAISLTNPVVITTSSVNSFQNNDNIDMAAIVGTVELNGVRLGPITRINSTQFSAPTDATGFTPYVSGGTATRPNMGRAIYAEQIQSAVIDDNDFDDFDIAVECRASTALNVTVGDRNKFAATTTPIERHAGSTSLSASVPSGDSIAVVALGTGAAATWDIRRGKKAWYSMSTNIVRTITGPTNMVAGQPPVTLLVTKGNVGASLVWATTILWDGGAAPDFLAMTTAQHAEVLISCLNFGAGDVLHGSWKIFG